MKYQNVSLRYKIWCDIHLPLITLILFKIYLLYIIIKEIHLYAHHFTYSHVKI